MTNGTYKKYDINYKFCQVPCCSSGIYHPISFLNYFIIIMKQILVYWKNKFIKAQFFVYYWNWMISYFFPITKSLQRCKLKFLIQIKSSLCCNFFQKVNLMFSTIWICWLIERVWKNSFTNNLWQNFKQWSFYWWWNCI